MDHVDLNQPVVVTYQSTRADEPIRFDSLRKALQTIMIEFEPAELSSAFICTKQGGLNSVEIRALYNTLRKAYTDNMSMADQTRSHRIGRLPGSSAFRSDGII